MRLLRTFGFAFSLLLLVLLTSYDRVAAQTCQVVPGKFDYVWGGLAQNCFVHTNNPRFCFITEDGGRLRRTVNSGQSFQFVDSPPCVQDTLNNAHFLNQKPRVGWFCGEFGNLISTTTTGNSWTQHPQQFDTNGDPALLWDTYFFDDELTGWLGGDHYFKRSTDGGFLWTDVTIVHPQVPGFSAADLEIYAIDFVFDGNDYIGIAAAEPGMILRTDQNSGGNTWTVVYDVCFAPTLCGVCPPANPCGTELELWDIEWVLNPTALNSAEAICVGGFGNQCGHILSTDDGGITWTQEFNRNDPCNTQTGACAGGGTADGYPTLYGVATFDDSTAIAVGYAGSIWLRNTSCPTPVWELQPQISNATTTFSQPFWGVDSNGVGGGNGVAWITSMFNGVFRTKDGGQTWDIQSVGNDVFRTGDIYFANATDGWCVAQGFRIRNSANGGLDWSDQLPGNNSGSFNDIVIAPNGQDGVAVGGFWSGGNLRIVRTGNGGTSWPDHASIVGTLPTGNRALSSVVHTTGQQFWAAGNRGIVLHTNNAGVDWTYKPINVGGGDITNVTLNGISFSSPNVGVVAGRQGNQGKIYVVTAATSANPVWTDFSPPLAANVLDFQGVAVKGSRAYVVGKKDDGSGTEVGVVYAWNGVGFSEVAGVPQPTLSKGTVGGQNPFRDRNGIFNEVAISPTTDEVYIGGTCGRFVYFDGSSWSELKSGTSYDITGMSFPSNTTGFIHGTKGSHNIIRSYTGP